MVEYLIIHGEQSLHNAKAGMPSIAAVIAKGIFIGSSFGDKR